MTEQNRRVTIRPLDKPGDLGWVVMAHGEMYAQEYGWDTSFDALVAKIAADYAASRDPAREAAWIAEADGQRAGCIFCVAASHGPDAGSTANGEGPGAGRVSGDTASAGTASGDGPGADRVSGDTTSAGTANGEDQNEDTAKLRLLLTLPAARGLGIGTALVRTCMDFARQAGYARMVLWTNDVLVAARRIYLAHGFTLTGEEPHHSFGADLVGQTYKTDLIGSAPS